MFYHILLFYSLRNHKNTLLTLYFNFISTRVLYYPTLPVQTLGLIICCSCVYFLQVSFLKTKVMSHSSLCRECLHLITLVQILMLIFSLSWLCQSRLNISDSFNYSSNQRANIGFCMPSSSNRNTNGVKESRLDHITSL